MNKITSGKKHSPYFLLPLILLCFASSSVQAGVKNDLSKDGLRGSVKSVKENYLDLSSGKIGCDPLTNTSGWLSNYDKDGFLIDKARYDCNNRVHPYYTSIRDKNGKTIELIQQAFDRTPFGHSFLNYDVKGNITEKIVHNDTGAIISKSLYKFDATGNQTEETTYLNNESQASSMVTMRYDKQGHLVETKDYAYSYYTKPSIYNSRRTYTYDAQGHATEIHYSYYPDTVAVSSNITKYDSLGNHIETVAYVHGKASAKQSFVYEYDAHNNWIKMTRYREGKAEPDLILSRKIEYY